MLFRCTLLLLVCMQLVSGIKFDLQAEHSPPVKCIWNYALSDTLVIVTINTKSNASGSTAGEDADQRVDVEVVDGSKHNNVYLSKKGIGKKETRMAINTHTHADLGVCFKNTLRKGECDGTACRLGANRENREWQKTAIVCFLLATDMHSFLRLPCLATDLSCPDT